MHPDNQEPEFESRIDCQKLQFAKHAICKIIESEDDIVIQDDDIETIVQYLQRCEESLLTTHHTNVTLYSEVIKLLCTSMRSHQLLSKIKTIKIPSSLKHIAEAYESACEKKSAYPSAPLHPMPTYKTALMFPNVTKDLAAACVHHLAMTDDLDKCFIGVVACHMNNYHHQTIEKKTNYEPREHKDLPLLPGIMKGMIRKVTFELTKDMWCFRYLITSSSAIPAWTTALLAKDEFATEIVTKVKPEKKSSNDFISKRYHSRFRRFPDVVWSNNTVSCFIKVVIAFIEKMKDATLIRITNSVLQSDYYDMKLKRHESQQPPIFYVDNETLEYGFIYNAVFYQYTDIAMCIKTWIQFVKDDVRLKKYTIVRELFDVAKTPSISELPKTNRNQFIGYLRKRGKRAPAQ